MNNKVLIKLIVPEIDESYDLFIPVNEWVWKVEKMIIKSVCELSNNMLSPEKKYALINKQTGNIYQNNVLVIQTDIRNATELILISGLYE